nr:helix-turn-helix transcriptional regulator [Xanthomonas phaseoli]
MPVPKAPPNPRQLFAARLKQARALRNVPSQRALGLKMGLEKHVAANRVNRYESQARGIDLDGLGKLAEVLDVPMAYLVADDADMADAVLVLAQLSPELRAKAMTALLKVAAAGDGAD